MLDPFEARAHLLREVEPVEAEEVPLAEARGRIVATPVVSRSARPASDNSAMDGFAVRAGDTAGASEEAPVVLPVVGESTADRAYEGSVGTGEAVRISTGGTLPAGTDAVVPVERTRRFASRPSPGDGRESPPGAGTVEILVPAAPGAHVRPRGEELRPGDEILPAGLRVNAAAVGLLASLDHRTVTVHRRVRVAVVVTGQEFVGRPVRAGGEGDPVGDANGPMLRALLDRPDALLTAVEHVGDRPEALADVLPGLAADADLVVSTGGASVGPHDVVAEAWEQVGAPTLFWKVAMKPGKPVRAGRLGGSLLLALPGNPQSVLAGFEHLVRPLIRRLAGAPGTEDDALLHLPLAEGLPPHARTRFMRGVLRGEGAGTVVEIPASQGSGMLLQAARCPVVAIVPPTEEGLAAGTPVRVRAPAEALAGRRWRPDPSEDGSPAPHAPDPALEEGRS